MEIAEARTNVCKECGRDFKSKAALAGHIGSKHKITMSDYVVKHFFNNNRPACLKCGEETRYIKGQYDFKRYCKDHANEARKRWSKDFGYGSKTGPDPGWKKGLTKETHPAIAKQSANISGENNPWYGGLPDHVVAAASLARSDKLKLTEEVYNLKCDKLRNRFEVLTPYQEYLGVKQLLTVKCSTCDKEDKRSLLALQSFSVCRFCSPASKEEHDVFTFASDKASEVLHGDRKAISPQELDIYFPNSKFAIEYNGLYWHTDHYKPRSYHLDKTLTCQERGITLFHIFSDEWQEKREIVESMISYRLQKTKHRFQARKCEVVELTSKEAKPFFDDTHISGHVKCSKAFALKYDNEIVACLSLRTPFHKKYRESGCVEIARYSVKRDSVVSGGFSRLFSASKKWASEAGYAQILSYADLRFGEGKVYEKSGFKHIGHTGLNYWYTDSRQRFNRFKFRAGNGLTEKQVTEQAGVCRIYGCGSNIYLYDLLPLPAHPTAY